MMKKFGLTDPDDLPDCWVVNVYNDDKKYIDWHSDNHPLFDAAENKADIWSISLGADGLFGVKLTRGTKLWDDMWSEATGRQREGFLALRNGDFVLMGDSFVGATSSADPPLSRILLCIRLLTFVVSVDVYPTDEGAFTPIRLRR